MGCEWSLWHRTLEKDLSMECPYCGKTENKGIVKNTGQESSIPNLRTMLSIISSTLTMLSEETEKLIDKVDKAEKSQLAEEGASKRKAPAKDKAKSLTSTDQVVQIIKGIKACGYLYFKSNWRMRKSYDGLINQTL
jgi:hypothetical protein